MEGFRENRDNPWFEPDSDFSPDLESAVRWILDNPKHMEPLER